MAATENADARTARLEKAIRPYLLQLLRDAPEYGSISISCALHSGEVGRVSLGAEITKQIAPRSDR